MEQNTDLDADLVHLARLALTGRTQDVQLYLQRVARRHRITHPELTDELVGLLREGPTRSSPLRRESARPVPIDVDSNLHLARVTLPDASAPKPILAPQLMRAFDDLVSERRESDRLLAAGLAPARSALLVGPPGAGKTMSVHWLASQLGVPLLTLDLAAVMSSFLGRTGSNIRRVLDYAKEIPCVLLLDEFDSIAKRRDDQADVGELKRLVTVLLQEIDDWPGAGLLAAATNHPELLDPAVWRRFDATFVFELPDDSQRTEAISRLVGHQIGNDLIEALATVYAQRSISDIERGLARAQRSAIMQGQPLEQAVIIHAREMAAALPSEDRRRLATQLMRVPGLSQRQVSAITGVSRDTMRKRIHPVGQVET